MEATKVFTSILQSLNYSLSKTPFSATISLKCAFIKRYQEYSSVKNIEFTERLPEDITDQQGTVGVKDDVVRKLEVENIELKAELESLKNKCESDQKGLLKETVKLQNIYDEEKKVSKTLEMNLADVRDSLLNLKKERHIF